MNTNSLKRFATTARNILLCGVRNRLQAVGFNEDGSVREMPEAVAGGTLFGGELITDPHFTTRWDTLRQRIDTHGVKSVIEEAAYTWFNRFLAIRILERNGLAQPVLDYENPDVRLPRIVTDARAGKTPILMTEDQAALDHVIVDGRLAFEQFSILIRVYCDNNPILRSCFGGITDYTSLLLPADILAPDNFIDLLNDADSFISPEDYTKAELIGWLYQFYIAEKKDKVMSQTHYDKSDIPAATQIFTPNWIVKYMVENTLGRIYLDNHPDDHYFSEKWKYLVNPTEPTPKDAVLHYNSLEELSCADLSCGSGHILNEMFDLLMQLYEDDFYSPREAIEAIFTKNMVGIDLDDRARQLAQFALLLKACQTDTTFADGHCMPRIYSMPEVKSSNWPHIHDEIVKVYSIVAPSQDSFNQVEKALELMEDANVLGSIMKFDISDETRQYLDSIVSAYTESPITLQILNDRQSDILGVDPVQTYLIPDESSDVQYFDSFAPIVDAFRVILILTDVFDVLCMNPPYMQTNKEALLAKYCKESYPNTKGDLYAIFIEKALNSIRKNGKISMITLESWMFFKTFKTFRTDVVRCYSIDSLVHMPYIGKGTTPLRINLGNVAFVISDKKPSLGSYQMIRYFECDENLEPYAFPYTQNSRYRDRLPQSTFSHIPDCRLGYWLSEKTINAFNNQNVGSELTTREGMATADNDRFLRLWTEISKSQFSEKNPASDKWYPYNKGGEYRKWYGNRDYVVDWSNDGYDIKNNVDARTGRIRSHNYNGEYGFRKSITWAALGTGKFSIRYCPDGALFDSKGASGFSDKSLFFVLGLLNSKVAISYLELFAPGMDFKVGDIIQIPLLIQTKKYIEDLVNENISISNNDWDAHETSWDFEINPLIDAQRLCSGNVADLDALSVEDVVEISNESDIPTNPGLLSDCYKAYCNKWERLFFRLHRNEEKINHKFIEIYGLQDELMPDIALKDITILQQGETKIKDAEDGFVLLIEDSKSKLKIPVSLPNRIEWQKDVIIKQFISYAVGCMMGRYRLDVPGLAIAHPNPSVEEIAPYIVPQTGMEWWIDEDGILPMMDEKCGFHDNAVNRFDKFIEVVFGPECKTDNLNFVREALSKDIVDYLRNDFYADHKKMYQNRPIYWMFSSNQKGKRAAFQCLVYMHRMNRFTPEHIRTNYLLPYIKTLAARETELSSRPSLSSEDNKKLKQLRVDLEECRDYQLRLHEFADQQIEIDLDDGVVKNYATFAPVLAKLK